ncbi:MAG TPA: hypothetical protein VJS15_10325 [Allosphingosinicella sp.]|nr:hypothetical protein [Allosphingosinicella sp.]
MNIQLIAEDLPELETEVGISGSAKCEEVGGAVCGGTIILGLIVVA